MPEYSILISKTAQKQLDKIPDPVFTMLVDVIQELKNNPRPQGHKKLKGRNGCRIRKGNYRIIYDIHDKVLTIEIVAAGHRKNIYR